MGTRDLFGEHFTITNPRNRLTTIRPIRMGYGPAKLAWDVGLKSDTDSLTPWNPNAKRFQDGDGEHVQGENYGERMSPYLKEAMDLLRADGESRRAWVPIYMPYDLLNEPHLYTQYGNHHATAQPCRESSNVPCTLGFNLRQYDGALIMQTVMRSQSIWGVMPYDLYLLTGLQELIANELGLDVGWYEHMVLSAHVYDRELDHIAECLADPKDPPMAMDAVSTTLSEAASRYPRLLDSLNNGANVLSHQLDAHERLLVATQPEVAGV